MERLISPEHGGELKKQENGFYQAFEGDYLHIIKEDGTPMVLKDSVTFGKLLPLGDGNNFYSKSRYDVPTNKFYLDKNRNIIVPLFIEKEDVDAYSSVGVREPATYDGVSITGINTGKKIVIDEKGEKLTGLELLNKASFKFLSSVYQYKIDTWLENQMTPEQIMAWHIEKKSEEAPNEITPTELDYMMKVISGQQVELPYSIENIPKKQLSPLEQKLLNIEKLPEDLYYEDSNYFILHEYSKPSDYDEQVYSIGLKFLNGGLDAISNEDFKYLYYSVDKQKAMARYLLHPYSLKEMDIIMEHLSLNESKSK